MTRALRLGAGPEFDSFPFERELSSTIELYSGAAVATLTWNGTTLSIDQPFSASSFDIGSLAISALTLTHASGNAVMSWDGTTVTLDKPFTASSLKTSAGIDFGATGSAISASSNALTYAPASASTGSDTEIGWRRVPISTQNGNYTFVQQDRGKCIQKTDTTLRQYTVPPSTFSPGDEWRVVNGAGTANIAILAGAGVTLRLAGSASTGSRVVGVWGQATIYCIASNVFLVSGPGVS